MEVVYLFGSACPFLCYPARAPVPTVAALRETATALELARSGGALRWAARSSGLALEACDLAVPLDGSSGGKEKLGGSLMGRNGGENESEGQSK
eukprot:scaffold27367_cov112-Isochrysis_galbana.AAC.3